MLVPTFTLQPHPLTPWGDFKGWQRLSDSPYIDGAWQGVAMRDGTHLTAADGTIDLTVLKRQEKTRLILSGPTSKAQLTTFKAGDEVLTIRLRSGVHISFLYGTKLTDIDQFLPNAGPHAFWLQTTPVAFPDFHNIETFIEGIARMGLLRRDIVVEDALTNRVRGLSARTVQRHFLATTGMTMSHIRQIRRAEKARNLLTSSRTLTSIAYEVGYSNPGHMTNAFKYFFGRTPSDLRALTQPIHKNRPHMIR